MKIKGLSASSYNSYDDCEWFFYLTQILKFSDGESPSTLMGHIAHQFLEILSKLSILKHNSKSKFWNSEYLWKAVLEHHYKKYPEVASRINPTKLKNICKGVHELLDSEYTPITDKTIGIEKWINFELKEKGFEIPNSNKYLAIRGFIDRIDKLDNKTLEIIDYKTGSRVKDWTSKDKSKKEPSDLKEDIQPRIYHLAAQHLYPEIDTFIINFIYITDGGSISVPFDKSDIKITKDLLLKRYRTIKANDDPQRNLTWRCTKFCGFGRNGMCKQVWDESKELGKDFIENKYLILNGR